MNFAQKYSFALMEPKLVKSLWWAGHIPFAFQLVKALEPGIIVELGVYSGTSFFAFCQVVERMKLSAKCYGIDEWSGDVHMGRFEEHIYRDVCVYRNREYPDISVLIRKKFNDAIELFKDNTIDLLHIDGTHTYESIQNDFYRWLPKMSSKGVVLIHDTNVTRENFGERAGEYGTKDFFQRIKGNYPHIEFKHSFGLGVILAGEDAPATLKEIMSDAIDPGFTAFFSHYGELISSRFEKQKLAGAGVSGKIRYLAKNIIRNPFFKPYLVKAHVRYNNNRPRLLHFIGNFHTGGSQRLVIDLIEHLGGLYESEVITRLLPVLPHYIGLKIREYKAAEADKIKSDVRIFKPNFIHIHYWGTIDYKWHTFIFRIAEELGIPVIENINIPIKPYVSSAVYKYVYVSNFVKENYSEGAGGDVVIYPGVDFNFFKRNNPSQSFGQCIGMVYRLEQDKLNGNSMDVFIKAAALNKHLKCLIVGNGFYYDVYKNRVRDEGLMQQFRFTGYVGYGNLPAFYRKMSIFVAPVYSESFGQVVPMAMGMGIPVVGYDVGALGEIISDKSLLAPAGDSDALAGIITSLLADKTRMMKISQFNRDRALKLFSLQAMIKGYKELYDECLAYKSAPL